MSEAGRTHHDDVDPVAGSAEAGRRASNRRGIETRNAMLEAAIGALASGAPGSASANRIAKDAGATWGAVKYQFGDVDGLWAAVLQYTAAKRGAMGFTSRTDQPLHERVAGIVDTLFGGLESPYSRAIENLRAALPREHAELEAQFPKAAAELASWKDAWAQLCLSAFEGLDVDPGRVSEVAAFIPGAMRGIVSEKQLGTYSDLDLARRGLTNAIVAYLTSPTS